MTGDERRKSGANRHDAEPAFVLHSYPFRETSLVVELFTRNAGRIAAVAKGARRPKSALRGVLLAFQPLLVSWSGKGELQTLMRAEWDGPYHPLKGLSLLCGFYLNELLLKLLPRHDEHEHLFETYAQTLQALGPHDEPSGVLRSFEQRLLRELGYAMTLDRDIESGQPIAAEERYTYIVERGPVSRTSDRETNGVELLGQTLLDMQSGDYTRALTQQQSKALMRVLINHYLGDQVLHTRQLLRDLQAL
ncbi:MAG TPA: DNA repair protein RecO [Burkholderiales bacterium]|nr:DNA repair protein RecO [Burkholderiales bacterium]